jgi:hypothetical protein
MGAGCSFLLNEKKKVISIATCSMFVSLVVPKGDTSKNK